MTIFAFIQILLKFLLEMAKFQRNDGNAEPGVIKKYFFKLFFFMSACSFVLNFQLINIGLINNKTLEQYRLSIENKKVLIKDLDICTRQLELQKDLNKKPNKR